MGRCKEMCQCRADQCNQHNAYVLHDGHKPFICSIASAISTIMVDAPPAAEPYMAVVSGNICLLARI